MKFSRLHFGVAITAAGLFIAGLTVSAQNRSSNSTSPAPSAQLPHFEDVTEKAGIHFQHSFGERELNSILEGTGSGCAWIDYNNDGLLDLYVVSGRHIDGLTDLSPADGIAASSHLYRNNGD